MYPEFFNDVFGPVMQPGSSSHTAGPCRLGYLAHCLLKGELKSITVRIDPDGSFSGTFGVMFEDLGMLSGAYGLLPDDKRIFDIKEILRKSGISFNFEYTDLGRANHPNAVEFVLENDRGESISLLGISTGGGMVETVEVMGKPFKYKGDRFIDEYPFTPVLPIRYNDEIKPQLFDSMAGWRKIAQSEHKTLAETAVEYEKRASGKSAGELYDHMNKLRDIMDRQTRAVYEEEARPLENGYSGFHYRKWEEYTRDHVVLSGEHSAKVIRNILGVQAQIPGVAMVPGPMGTGGGFLYSALKEAAAKLGSTSEEITDALFVAAGIGAICYTRSSPTGEVTGCAGECGVCSAMTAGAITYLAKGTAEQVEAAASLALQMSLGWPCDPIPGGQNQPCFSRFITAIEMATVFADLALSGRDAVLPFHEVVDVMDRMGKEMPGCYKCTSKGATCTAPAALRISEEFKKKMNARQ
ncbi:MAG: L-serine ammonia-lyase, iron-sulfur-dependent, subunit alpha [Lachnospiraceae bacterium]|nr:L-serine ammonia-lyase, iron-sulfur-dependent, subunit alpha [Lachnospiraceae bacterium]